MLRYKGVVLDSVIEDRLLAQASTNAEDQDRVERLKADQRQLDRLLLQAPQKLSEASQQVEKLEQEVEELEGQLAEHVAGVGQARRAMGVTLEQVQARLPRDGALIEYVRYWRYLGKGKFEGAYGAVILPVQGNPRWVPLDNAAQVDKLSTRYRTLADSGRGDDELAANLKAHKACCSDVDKRLRSLHAVLVVLTQASIAAKPSEAALYNPGEACDLEGTLPTFDDL